MATYYPKYYFYNAVGMSNDIPGPKPTYHERLIDFSVRNVNTGDVMNIFPVPPQTLVENFNYLTVTTVGSASSTFVLASGTAAITYVASAAAVAAGSYGVPAAISANTAQKWYNAQDDLQINTVATANLTSGQIRAIAVMTYPQPTQYVDVDGNTHVYTYVDRNNWQLTAPVIP